MENSKIVRIKERIKNFFDRNLNNKKDISVGNKKPDNKLSPDANLKMY